MDKEKVDFVYRYLVPRHMFKNFKCRPIYIMSNTHPCLHRDNKLYKFPKKIQNKEFSFVSSFVKFEDDLGGMFYLINFILDVREMDSFKASTRARALTKLPFKHSHYSTPKKDDIKKGFKMFKMPTVVLKCKEFDILSLQNKKKLKYSEEKSIIYEWLLKKKT